jgi:hypothetical protein
MTAKTNYEDYLKLALQHRLRLLNRADELPPSVYHRALWQCLVTGESFARTYHQIKHHSDPAEGEYPSPGQHYVANYLKNYYVLAEQLGIEFIYDPVHDLAPYSVKTEVKWRGRPIQNKDGTIERRIVVASYHQLAYGQIRKDHRRDLGLTEIHPTINETETDEIEESA